MPPEFKALLLRSPINKFGIDCDQINDLAKKMGEKSIGCGTNP